MGSNGKGTGNIAAITLGQTRDWLQFPVMASVVAGIQRAAGEFGLRLLLDDLPDPSKPSPSQVFRVSLAGGVPQAARQIYGNAGTQIGGAGVAARAGNRLLIGSALDGRLLDCTLQ